MHHHQDESGMNEEMGKERNDVARRRGATATIKLAGNVAKRLKKEAGVRVV